jgi:hypothetical protein
MVDKTAKPSVASLIASLAGVFKAIPSDKLEDLTDVVDMWTEPKGEHGSPSRAEIVTGPAERMSGDGAVKMIGEYSTVAPQQGLTAQYAEFQRMLDGWGKSFAADLTGKLNPVLARHDAALKSILGIFAELQKAQTATAAAQTAAAPAAPSADTFLGKSLIKLAKAKSALRKADLADETERDVRKGFLEEANDLLKSAKRLLAKASEDMEDTADEEGCEKALSTLRALTKAVAKADEDDKKRDEEEAAEKARVAKSEEETKKKIEEAKKDGEKEKQAEKEAAEAAEKARQAAEAAAKSNAVSQEQILKALEGLTVLPTTVQGLIDAVMGKSQNPGGAPEITKGQVLEVDFAKRVDQAIDENRLSDEGITRAMSLVQHMHLAKAGRIDMKVVEQEIDKSPAEVRDLFRPAA